MGYTTSGDGIINFWPDNDESNLYIASGNEHYITSIIESAKEHFGDRFDEEKILISAEYLHCYCLGYDRYDPGDYITFIHITMEK